GKSVKVEQVGKKRNQPEQDRGHDRANRPHAHRQETYRQQPIIGREIRTPVHVTSSLRQVVNQNSNVRSLPSQRNREWTRTPPTRGDRIGVSSPNAPHRGAGT